MAPDLATQDRRLNYVERVLRVLVHIQRHLDEELSLEQLASVAHFSPFHFHRVFRGLVGEPVKQHVRRLRLERAAQRLKHTNQPIVAIAFEAGYEAHESFTRAFHGAFGCSPTDFRAAANLSARLTSASKVHYLGRPRRLVFTPIHLEIAAMNVETRTIEPMRVAFLRHVGPYGEVSRTWERLTDWAGRECLFGPETHFFGLCWDDPEVTEPSKIRYDACVTVDDSVDPAGDIGVTTVAGGSYAVALHEGAYGRLNETYAALLGGWFPDHACEPGDPPSLEFYLNDPNSTEAEDLLTEVCMPIRGSR